MDFQVWDFPGQVDFFDPIAFDTEAIFGGDSGCALIWVIDAQDEYIDAIARLNLCILSLRVTQPHVNIEVFIHKVDGLSDDFRVDIQRDIVQRIQDELSDVGYENAPVTFHLTSIYDHSIFEAFSRVLQKLVPYLATLEALLNDLCRKCRFEKVYLFDALTKIYVATDSTPVDMPSYEICSDFIDVIVDISEVYGWERSQEYLAKLEGTPFNKPLVEQAGSKYAESCIVLSDQKRPVLLREVDQYLALVAIMREGTHGRMPMVTFNVEVVVQALTKVFEITRKGKS